MTNYVCRRCGTQFPESEQPPASCPICTDDRQYLGAEGQQWTSIAEMLKEGFRNELRAVEPGLNGIGTRPAFAIGQRALILQTPDGNVLWDCISLLDDETAGLVERLGGLAAIAISHAHFNSSMVEWSARFGNVPIYLHEDNRPWVMRPAPPITYWGGDAAEIFPGVVLIRCGGHFPGSTVLHWAAGSEGRGALLTGDTISAAADRRFVSFMYSYPNNIPLAPWEVRKIVNAVRPLPFYRLYGGWWDAVVERDASRAVGLSAERYIRHIEGS